MRNIFSSWYGRMQVLHKKYDRYIFPMALLVGFVIDNITFSSINLVASGVLLFCYLVLIGVCISIFHFADFSREQSALVRFSLPWVPVVVQYLFGGVFSAFLVFFLRSAPFGASLIFVLLLVAVMIGSEVFREKFLRLDTQMGLYFAAIFLYLFFAVSIVIGEVGTLPFLVSSVVSAALISLFLFVLLPKTQMKFRRLRWSLYGSVFGIFMLINALYFLGLIPPVPLVLKEVGVYHSVVHTETGYIALREKEVEGGLFGLFNNHDHVIHNVPGTPVYVFSSIYAPRSVEARIYQVWQYYDEKKGGWVTTDRIAYAIIGGRDKGYRGYAYKTSLHSGQWRVRIETAYGALIGEVSFTIKKSKSPVPLVKQKI